MDCSHGDGTKISDCVIALEEENDALRKALDNAVEHSDSEWKGKYMDMKKREEYYQKQPIHLSKQNTKLVKRVKELEKEQVSVAKRVEQIMLEEQG